MAESLKEIRRQMAANAERGERHVKTAEYDRDRGDALGAVRDYGEAAHAYGMSTAYAIALGQIAKGLGDVALEIEAGTEQGRYCNLAYRAERASTDLLSGPLYRAVADATSAPGGRP